MHQTKLVLTPPKRNESKTLLFCKYTNWASNPDVDHMLNYQWLNDL